MADLLETLTQASSFGTLLKALDTAGLGDILKSSDRYTLLAPTNEAFDKLPQSALDQLLANPTKLKRVLLYHVLFGDVRAEDLAETNEAPTVEGSIVAVEQGDSLKVNGAQVTETDILADNGVIHTIDSVLIPTLVEAES